jgi:hypothetical protein
VSAKQPMAESKSNLAELVELNRFVGREFLLWLWFESELYDTNLSPSTGDPFSLWLETQITLASEAEETRIKAAMPGATPEAKQALRQGKLPTTTRMTAMLAGAEFRGSFKADQLALGTLKVPAELKADEDKYEALYDRMRLVELLERQLEALYKDFVTLRLDPSWERAIVPELRRWARGKEIDEAAYTTLNAKIVKRPKRQPS